MNEKNIWYCSTPQRGQGQFNHGNSTVTVSSTELKIFALEFGTKSFFFQAEDGIRDAQESRGLGDVYKRQMGLWAT